MSTSRTSSAQVGLAAAAGQQRFAWSRRRDPGSQSVRRVAHLIGLPIEDHRMAVCSQPVDGREFTLQVVGDATPRCGRCEEAERTYLAGRVEAAA